MRAPQRPQDKTVEAIQSAATVVLAWGRGLRPESDLVFGQPYVFDLVEGLLGARVPASPRSRLRERAVREETAAAIDIVLAASIARRVITGVGNLDPTVLSRAASLAKRVASGRDVQKVVSGAIDRVERELRSEGMRVAVKTLSSELSVRGRLSPREIEGVVGDHVRLGWAWYRNLAQPLGSQRRKGGSEDGLIRMDAEQRSVR